jgi:hypothetical protein
LLALLFGRYLRNPFAALKKNTEQCTCETWGSKFYDGMAISSTLLCLFIVPNSEHGKRTRDNSASLEVTSPCAAGKVGLCQPLGA